MPDRRAAAGIVRLATPVQAWAGMDETLRRFLLRCSVLPDLFRDFLEDGEIESACVRGALSARPPGPR